MKKIIEFFMFAVFSAFLGAIMTTTMALDRLDEQKLFLRMMPSDESDLVAINMRGWLESEGLTSELTEDIVNKFISNANLMTTHVDYSETITQQIDGLLKIARLFSVVGSIILVLGFILYPRFKKRNEQHSDKLEK